MTTATFFMFVGEQCGKAEEAVNFYVSLFRNSGIRGITYFESEEPVDEGLVKLARFTLGGSEYMANDSPADHDFTFTPATSTFVECDSEEELDSLFDRLSEGGEQLMPLDDYGFSKKFGWINDRYGVSWQLNLAD